MDSSDKDSNYVYANEEVVWGKVPGYPWWPGIYIGTSLTNKGVVNVVNFIGEESHALLSNNKIAPYKSNYELYGKNPKMRLRKAIAMADSILERKPLEDNAIDFLNKLVEEHDDKIIINNIKLVKGKIKSLCDNQINKDIAVNLLDKLESKFQKKTSFYTLSKIITKMKNKMNLPIKQTIPMKKEIKKTQIKIEESIPQKKLKVIEPIQDTIMRNAIKMEFGKHLYKVI